MATFEERKKQYEDVDVPAAWRTHVAGGIRKKFADEFDFEGLSDQEVIARHHSRFSGSMTPEAYKTKLGEVYGKDFTAPSAPTETLGDKAHGVVEAGKEFAGSLVPFLVPEAGKMAATAAGAKAVATKIPVASQIGFLGGHTINAAVDVATAKALEETKASLPVPDEQARVQDFYARLLPGLTAKGYTEEQVMQEARQRARNLTRGYQQVTETIQKDIEEVQQAALGVPAKAAADAFFLGVGAPMIEGMLQKGLQKIGLSSAAQSAAKAAPSVVGRIASHVRTGVLVGAPGMGIHGSIDAALQAAVENKTPDEIGKALVQGAVEGGKLGAIGGAIIGGAAGVLETGVGAAARPLVERRRQREWRETKVQQEVDDARLRGWQARRQSVDAAAETATKAEKTRVAVDAKKRIDAINRTADEFDPHYAGITDDLDPAEAATTLIQQKHGDDAALSEAGLRAASKIEERLRLYRDANEDVATFGQRPLPPTGSAEPGTVGPPLGPIEQGGRTAPTAEFAPRLEAEVPSRIEAALAPVREGRESGYTFNPDTFETDAKPGFVVSVASKNVPAENLTAADVLQFKREVQPQLEALRAEGKHATVGVFASEAQPGTYSIDLNVTVPGKDEALRIGQAFNQEAVAHIGPKGWIENISVPKVEALTALREISLPTPQEKTLQKIKSSGHADVEMTQGALHIKRLGLPEGKTAEAGKLSETLDDIIRRADEEQLPVTVGLSPAPGPRGGMIPVEKQVEWYRQRGFKLDSVHRVPEGKMSAATMRRDPVPPPATKMTMLDAQREMMERALAAPDSPTTRELAAPAREPLPGRWHQANLQVDASIAAARERIKAREAEFPEAQRKQSREGGFIGDRPDLRDPTSYDWADFADRVQIGVNVMLKHGLNKAEWIEHMVRELGDKFRNIAERVYQESVATYHSRRPRGNDEARMVISDYVHSAGLGRGAVRHDLYPEVNPQFAERVAGAYDKMKNAKPGSREHQDASNSYEALNHEIDLQYKAIEKAGYKIEFVTQDPYPSSAEMRADVAQNKRLRIFKTGESHHPFMTPEQNDKLRAVHDFFGHAAEGYEFGPRGEDAAFHKHASTLSDRSIPALATETRGQNSWVNFLPKNAKLAPKDRPFAEQKFGLLPSWAYDDVMQRSARAKSSRLAEGFPRGERGDGRALVTAAVKLSRGVRPVKSPGAVRSRFVADGTDAVNEMMTVSPESAKWYHDDIERMHQMTEQEIPSLAQPGNKALFDLLLGFTSPNTNVPQNYARAFALMKDFERSGKVPFLQRFGQEVNIGSRKWVPKLNQMIERFDGDLDAMRNWLLSKDEKGVYNVTREFGPKVGPFTLNIQGIHDQVTVDVWMVRRLRRLSGTLNKTDEKGTRSLNEDFGPTAQEQRDIEESIRELSKRTGVDADAIQAMLWDHEKMIWERAGLMAPRIPFSQAAEQVLRNVGNRSLEIERKYAQERLGFE